jgi:Na+/H+-translocating membrane pyrophosphatase
MGADLFGSFAESTCAALVIAAAAGEGSKHTLSAAGWETWLAMDFLLLLGTAEAFNNG